MNALQMQEAPAGEKNQYRPLKAESLSSCGSVTNWQIPTDTLHSQWKRLKSGQLQARATCSSRQTNKRYGRQNENVFAIRTNGRG